MTNSMTYDAVLDIGCSPRLKHAMQKYFNAAIKVPAGCKYVARNMNIYYFRITTDMTFKEIGELNGVTGHRARQIYLKLKRIYARHMFTYDKERKNETL